MKQIRKILDPLQEVQQGVRRLANQIFSGRSEVSSGVGDTLGALGEVSVDELVVAPAGILRRELVVDTPEHRVFEAIGGRLEGAETLDAIVLVLGDVTQEREIERRVRRHERLAGTVSPGQTTLTKLA